MPRASAKASEVKQTEIKNRDDKSRQVRTQVWYRVGDNVYEAEGLQANAERRGAQLLAGQRAAADAVPAAPTGTAGMRLPAPAA